MPIDKIGNTPVKVALCSVEGECFRIATTDPRDDEGTAYAEFRPHLVAELQREPEVEEILLSMTN